MDKREALRDDLLLVKRSSGLARLLKPDRWQSCPIALFREGRVHWLIIFVDKSTSTLFFAPNRSGTSAMSASELQTALRSCSAVVQNFPIVNGVVELLCLNQVIAVDSSTKVMKRKSTAPSEVDQVIYCLTIRYSSGSSRVLEKHKKLKLGSTDHGALREWISAIERLSTSRKASEAATHVPPTEQISNEVYTTTGSDNTFNVKLTSLPSTCPAVLGLQSGGQYQLRFEEELMTLLSLRNSVLTVWSLIHIRGFGRPCAERRFEDFWFDAGRRCMTGCGQFWFESPYASRMHTLVQQRLTALHERIRHENAAPPPYVEVSNEPDMSAAATSSSNRNFPRSESDAAFTPRKTSGPLNAIPLPPKPIPRSSSNANPSVPPRSVARSHSNVSVVLPPRSGIPLPPVPSSAPLYPSNEMHMISTGANFVPNNPSVGSSQPEYPSAPPIPVYDLDEAPELAQPSANGLLNELNSAVDNYRNRQDPVVNISPSGLSRSANPNYSESFYEQPIRTTISTDHSPNLTNANHCTSALENNYVALDSSTCGISSADPVTTTQTTQNTYVVNESSDAEITSDDEDEWKWERDEIVLLKGGFSPNNPFLQDLNKSHGTYQLAARRCSKNQAPSTNESFEPLHLTISTPGQASDVAITGHVPLATNETSPAKSGAPAVLPKPQVKLDAGTPPPVPLRPPNMKLPIVRQ